MRKGDFKLFFTPMVYNPETQTAEPIQNGGAVGKHLGNYGPYYGTERDSLFPTMTDVYDRMPVVTIDPMSIPIASAAAQITDDGGIQGDDLRQENLLTVIPDAGLHVEPYRDAFNRTVVGSPYNKIVTLSNFRGAFADCNDVPLNNLLESLAPVKIATCANIADLINKLEVVVSSLLEIQNRLQVMEERPYDGSGATTNIDGNNANPGPANDDGRNVPYMIVVLNEPQGGGHQNDFMQPANYLQANSLDHTAVYALDHYRVRVIPQKHTDPITEKEYLGTVYIKPNSFGQVSYRLGVVHHASGVSGALYNQEWASRLVFRTLRPGESPVNVVTIPD